MGSRGVSHIILSKEENRKYKTTGKIYDAEILVGKTKEIHSLPEISASPLSKYIKLNPDGTFREMRVYQNHKLLLEIGYHKEPLGNGDNILHAHDIGGKEYSKHPTARRLTDEEFDRYKEYFVGLDLERIKK